MKTMKDIIEDSLAVLLRGAAMPDQRAGVPLAAETLQAGTTGQLKQLKRESMD
jgi:hypothetical protein